MRQCAVRLTAIVATTLLGISITAASAASPQQDGKVQRVGIIAGSSPYATWRQARTYQNFFKGLHDLGYEEGRNIAIEFRSAEGHSERLPHIAAELGWPQGRCARADRVWANARRGAAGNEHHSHRGRSL